MKTLDRYILGKVASRFAMLLAIFVGVVIGGQLGTFIGRGVPPEALLGVIPTFVLLALPIAVPLASSTALLVAIGGMVRAGEFQALAAAGVDPRRVILRMWKFVVVVAMLVAVLAHVALPVDGRDYTQIETADIQPYRDAIDAGLAAVMHAHIHVIPRRIGDVADPRGGVRWVMPDKAHYWEEARK